MEKALVIIPAFDEEGSVGKVVEEVHTHLPQLELPGVNDGPRISLQKSSGPRRNGPGFSY